MDSMKIKLTEIQRFCMHDGPGIRTTVFLKGCPLRCAWCHNPETQKSNSQLLYYSQKCIGCTACAAVCPNGVHSFEGEHTLDRSLCHSCGLCAKACPTGALELVGKDCTVEEILAEVAKDAAFYGEQGGVTVSGGEPFLQKEATLALLKACKEKGFHTAVETCGFFDSALLEDAVAYTDLFLWDLKDTNEERHKQYTGVSNDVILSNLKRVDALGAKVRLRCILVNGVNTEKAHYEKIAEIASSLSQCEGVDLLSYHAYGGSKATFLGLADNGRVDWIPTQEQIDEAQNCLHSFGINV